MHKIHTFSLFNKFKAFMIVSRWEYLPSEILVLTIVSMLASSAPVDLWLKKHLVLCGSTVWVFSHFIGSQVNCLTDYQVDKLHKIVLPQSISLLGKSTLVKILIGEIIITLIMVLLFSFLLEKPLLSALWLLGLIIAFMYSVEPFRFKRRGILNPLALIACLVLLPMLFGYHLLRPDFSIFFVIFMCGIIVQFLSFVFISQIPDFKDDIINDIMTPCVKWGIQVTARTATLLFIISSLSLCLLFGYVLISRAIIYGIISILAFVFCCYIAIKKFVNMSFIANKLMYEKDNNNEEIRTLMSTFPHILVYSIMPITISSIFVMLTGGL